MRPVCGRNVRGSSAYSRTSTAWPVERRRLGASGSPSATRICCATRSSAGDELRHRVLDLDAAVQLEEVEVAAVEHELGRARRSGSRSPARTRRRRRSSPRAAPGRARRRATPRAPSGGGAGPSTRARRARRRARAVAEQLDLDVARPLDVALAEDAVVAERGLRLAPRGRERLVELVRRRGRRACRARRRRRPP